MSSSTSTTSSDEESSSSSSDSENDNTGWSDEQKSSSDDDEETPEERTERLGRLVEFRAQFNKRRSIMKRVNDLPPELEAEILARLDCAGRSRYCSARRTPLQEKSKEPGDHPCEQRAFRRLHNAKCNAEEERDRLRSTNKTDVRASRTPAFGYYSTLLNLPSTALRQTPTTWIKASITTRRSTTDFLFWHHTRAEQQRIRYFRRVDQPGDSLSVAGH